LEDSAVRKAFINSQPTKFEATDFAVSKDTTSELDNPISKKELRQRGIGDKDYAFVLAYHIYKDTRQAHDPIPDKLKQAARAMK
jgi:peroxiredoxin